MALRRWKTVHRVLRVKNPWWEYYQDAFELPNGRPGEYHFVHTNGSSMVIPVLDDGRIVTVNQYRYLVDRESVEFPCGSVKDGSTHEETAEHELREETGYVAASIHEIGRFNPYNGVTDEFCRVYLARGLKHVGGVPDETEEFEVLPLETAEIEERIKNGAIWDGMSIAAWQFFRGSLAAGFDL